MIKLTTTNESGREQDLIPLSEMQFSTLYQIVSGHYLGEILILVHEDRVISLNDGMSFPLFLEPDMLVRKCSEGTIVHIEQEN